MRKLVILGLVAGAMLAVTGALADVRDELQTPNLPHAALGEIYDRSTILPPNQRLIALPVPQAPEPAPMQGKIVLQSDSSKLSNTFSGSAIAAPRGGAIYSPKQQDDREIRRLIRRLE